MKKICISPSILSEVNNLEKTIEVLNKQNIEAIHFDVMDGIFVTNKTFDYNLIKRVNTNKIIDTHLMIEKPLDVIDKYLEVSDIVTIHIEAVDRNELRDFLENKGNKKIGLSIKPKTNVDEIKEFLKYLDLVLVMSVEPGYGGQKFMDSALIKLKELKEYKEQNNLSYIIEVDGGVNDLTFKKAIENGAEWLVVGTYLFKEGLDKVEQRIEGLRNNE